jgi:surfeit locus 1 family protein
VAEAEAEAERFRYRPMRLRGHYVPESQVLLDNMTSHGVAGYQVLTPFRVAGDGRADGDALVLVNRGWVPASPDRSELPDVALAAEGEVFVSGRIDRLPRAALELDAPATAARGPLVVLSYPDFAAIEAALGTPVRRFQLLLDPAAPAGFVREWAPPADRANRNIAYAVQWFGLALLALVIAIGIAWKSRRGAREIPA